MLTILLTLALGGDPIALASTTSDTALPGDPVVTDAEWILRDPAVAGARLYLAEQAQAALCGDLDGDGLDDLVGDIDALCYLTAHGPDGPMSVLFSTISGGPGFDDGDLLAFDSAGGLQVVIPESEFVAVLQPQSGSFDLNGAAWRAPDQYWFTVNADLTGTVLGDIADGDILVYDRGAGTAWVAYSEADVQTLVDTALGASPGSIGEVLALAFEPTTDELWFTVQSPSAYDGAVFGDGSGGRLVPGFEEADWAFGGAAELDALAVLPPTTPAPPVLLADQTVGAPGSPVVFEVRHGTPNGRANGLLATARGYVPLAGNGIGFLSLDPANSEFRRLRNHGRYHRRILDAAGGASYSWTLPLLRAGRTQLDLYLQVHDDVGGLSAPVHVRVQ